MERGLHKAVKLLPILGDTQRGCVGVLGVRHGQGKARMDVPRLYYALLHLFLHRGKKTVRNTHNDDWRCDERRDVRRRVTLAVPKMSSQTWSSYWTLTLMAELLGVRSWLQHNMALMEPAVSGAEGKRRQGQRLALAHFCSHPLSQD